MKPEVCSICGALVADVVLHEAQHVMQQLHDDHLIDVLNTANDGINALAELVEAHRDAIDELRDDVDDALIAVNLVDEP